MAILIRNGHIIDPANDIDRVGDLYLNSRILALDEAPDGFRPERTIDASGKVVCPGLIDLRARLREPGLEHKGTIASESRAAAAAGITTLCCPPDTDPVLDTPAVAEQIRHRAAKVGLTRVLPLGALTLGLGGEHLSEMKELKDAGCVAMSNAERAIPNTLVMRRALEYAATLGLTVILDAEDPWLGRSGSIHEGEVSTRLGLPGIPDYAETIAVARDLMLVEQTGVRAHFSRLSTAGALKMVAEARAKGLPVSADTSAHQLYLTELDVGYFNALCHVRPPLRSQRDREALRRGLAEGTISAVCSDHQPHDLDAKLAPFTSTEPGISALETLLPLVWRLAEEGSLTRSGAIASLTCRPAEVLNLKLGSFTPGTPADVCIFDPEHFWTLDAQALLSRGKNTPFGGWGFKGRVTHTLLEGRLVFELNDAAVG